jgi:hypothetical protein
MGPRSILLVDTGGFSLGEKSGLGVNPVTPHFTAELHLSRLIGTASHPAMQKIRIIGFFFEHRLHWQFEVLLLLFTVCTCV